MSEPNKTPKAKNKKPLTKITNNSLVMNGERQKNSSSKRALPDDGIAKSKQLAHKMQNSKSSSYGRPKYRCSPKDEEVRLCGNGKPMPSLSELEKMFEDSDNDEENKAVTPNTNPSTPKKVPKPKPEEKLLSPTTISKIADRMLNLVSNINNPAELLDDSAPTAIIKPKKRKKPEKPYIVGCKDRPKVPEKKTIQFCKGDDKFGPEHNEADSDDDIPKKRAKRGIKLNISKSIFNAKSDEIAARLKECEGDSDGSSDSNKTVAYEYYTPINSGGPRTFSPLPSTSKDNETFVKNDQRFNESLISENLFKSNVEEDIEILETPCETIEINDTITNKTANLDSDVVIEIADDCSTPVFDDKILAGNKNASIDDDDTLELLDIKPAIKTNVRNDDDCVQVNFKPSSPIIVEDYYSNLDIDNIPNDDVCEVIDVDDIIAENKAIIEKFSNTTHLDTVTLVETTDTNMTVQSDHSDRIINNNCGTIVKPTKTVNNINVTNDSINMIPDETNEQPSVIVLSNSEIASHRPIVVESGNGDVNVDVQFIDETNNLSILSNNRNRNHRVVESALIDLELSLVSGSNRHQELGGSSNAFRSNLPLPLNLINLPPAPNTPRSCHPPTGLRIIGDNCDYNSENEQPKPQVHITEAEIEEPNPNIESLNNSHGSPLSDESYQEHLKMLEEFFRDRQRCNQNKRKLPNKKNARLTANFLSWLKSNVGSKNRCLNSGSNAIPARNQTSNLSSTSTNSPDKTGKRIGDCPICMDSLSNKQIVSTMCGHVFCMDCIKLSIRSNGSKCPTCRKALRKGTGYHQIFL